MIRDTAGVETSVTRSGLSGAGLTGADLTTPGMTASGLALRPQFRGTLHRWSVPFAVALSVWLVLLAPDAPVRAGYIVYGVCIVTMLAVSGVYHLPRHSDRLRRVLRRIDHSTILLAIAGSYTGVIVAGMTGTTRIVLLAATWAIAGIGIAMRTFWFDCPGFVMAAVYIGAGWMAMLNPGAYLRALDGTEIALLVAGGLMYTVGAAVLGFRWPNPWPSKFGYHEVFHTFVVLAALCHWAALFLLVRN